MRMLFRPEYFLVAVLATTGLYSPPPSVPLYVRMSLVESPLELSQLDRCELAADLKGDRAGTWVFFYGQVERGASGSWEALRARTACEPGRSDEKVPAKITELAKAAKVTQDLQGKPSWEPPPGRSAIASI